MDKYTSKLSFNVHNLPTALVNDTARLRAYVIGICREVEDEIDESIEERLIWTVERNSLHITFWVPRDLASLVSALMVNMYGAEKLTIS